MLIFTLAGAAGFILALLPIGGHQPLDPDEPLAADGSMADARARSSSSTACSAPSMNRSRRLIPTIRRIFAPTSTFKNHGWTIAGKQSVASFLPSPNSSVRGQRTMLWSRPSIIITKDGAPKKAGFVRRGPNASAFIEEVWATDLDREIDAFARNLLIAGYLPESDLRRRNYPELAKVVTGVKKAGAACGR
jgi:hypothetical protein